MITPEEKKNIAKKIKALFAKTTEAGASEHEAMAAMQKGRELLEKYQLELSDLDIREEGTEVKRFDWSAVGERLYTKVGNYCECQSWKSDTHTPIYRTKGKYKGLFSHYQQGFEFKFVGIKSDAVFAEWLFAALVSFVENQQADFYMDNREVSVSQSHDFVTGCVDRLRTRLQHEIDERKRNRPLGSGRDLVPLKNAMIKEKMQALGVTLVFTTAARPEYRDPNAYMAGQAAGNNVGLHRPMSYENSEPLKIGSK